MKDGALTAVKECLNIKPWEKVLVLTDRKMLGIGKTLYEASKKVAPKTSLVVMKLTGRDGKEPPKDIAKAMKASDAVIAVTYYSLTHTRASWNAYGKGARIASMPRVAKFSFTKGGLTADYEEVNRLCKKMNRALKGSKGVMITSSNGTNVSLSVKGRKWHDDEGIFKKGTKPGNLPAGEVGIAPVENKTNGVIVFDKMGELGENIKLTIKNGVAIKIERSRRLLSIVKKIGRKARIVGELGIGTNPKARVIGNVLEDEKVLGTVHLALGRNIFFGGKNDVQFHKDGIIIKPTLSAGKKILIKEGKWKV